MTQNKISVQNSANMPTVQITSNRNRLKIYDKKTQLPKIYLKGNSHFEFEFFNPTQERIGVLIYLNNKCINVGRMLIIRPGDHGFLERYLNDNDARKFLFDTYVVNGGNEEVKKAIEKNGLIKIEFYKEREEPVNFFKLREEHGPYTYPNDFTITYGNGTSGGFVHNTFTGEIPVGSSVNYCASNELSKFKTNFDNFNMSSFMSQELPRGVAPTEKKMMKRSMSKKVETGRIEKGAASDQKFEYTTFTPNYIPFHTVEMQLLPESTKQINFKTQTKLYCPGCRYRIRDINWKWCPKCSTNLESL